MKRNIYSQIEFELDREFKDRAFELLDETQSLQYAEGLRLGSAMGNLHAREYKRIEGKYGKDHPRTRELAVRVEANEKAKKVLFAKYSETSTPQADPGEGWAVDGFVRTSDLAPVAGVTVAAYDRSGRWYQELGYSCTSESGYFSIAVEDISEKAPRPIFLRASEGKKLLPSNEVRISPEPKRTDRVEIIVGKHGDTGDCESPDGEKDKPKPPTKEEAYKEKPSSDGKKEGPSPEPLKEASDNKEQPSEETTKDYPKDKSPDERKEEERKKREEQRKIAVEKNRKNQKERQAKRDAKRASKRSGSKKRR